MSTSTSPAIQTARFCATFLALMTLLALATSTGAAERYVHTPLSRLIASTSAAVLSLFGRASASGDIVHFQGFDMQIAEVCDGVLPILIYLSAVLAFPSRWVAKAWGGLIGAAAISLMNFMRVVTLMIVGAWRPDLFDRVHIYVWQALLIGLSMAVWVFWVDRFVRPRPQPGS